MAFESSCLQHESIDTIQTGCDQMDVVIGPEEMIGCHAGHADEAIQATLTGPLDKHQAGQFTPTQPAKEQTARRLENAPTLPERYAVSISRHPRKHLLASLVMICALSVIGMTLGNFYIRIDTAGWWSRSTPIANRATQERVIYLHGNELRRNDTLWDLLTTTELANWQNADFSMKESEVNERHETACNGTWYGSLYMTSANELNLVSIWRTTDAESTSPAQSMLDADAIYDLCIVEKSTLQLLEETDLCLKCPTAQSDDVPVNCIQPYSLVAMARYYISYLEGNFVFRPDGSFDMQVNFLKPDISCEYLRDSWSPLLVRGFADVLEGCIERVSQLLDETPALNGEYTQCLFPIFAPSVMDTKFTDNDPPLIRYTSSIYATKNDDESVEALYELSQSSAFNTTGSSGLKGTYDTGMNSIYTTPRLGFYARYMNQIVVRDVGLGVASAFATLLCILFHTRSPFLTIMGLLQIMLSFPLAYFVYYFIFGLEFFPFVNFNAIFIVFSLGADDIFVAVDKWKNVRLELHDHPIDEVAALALPNAAYCMFVTSVTTAAAFFGTSVISVPAVECFGIFCGLVVTMDYFLNILLVFPSLCLYDQWIMNGSKNLLVSMDVHCKSNVGQPTKSFVAASTASVNATTMVTSSDHNSGKNQDSNGQDCVEALPEPKEPNTDGLVKAEQHIFPEEVPHENNDKSHIFVHSVLDKYYFILHKCRWPLMALCIGAIILCGFITAKFEPTDQANPPFLPSSNSYEMHRLWSEKLLSSVLVKDGFGKLFAIWGVIPADTGYHLNPDKWTKLVLDEDFDPSSAQAQHYLLHFCSGFSENGLTTKVSSDYECPINAFDAWLKEQSTLESPIAEYRYNCNGTTSVPVPTEVFDQCFIAWSEYADARGIYQYKGKVKIMTVEAFTNTTYESPYLEQREEFLTLEKWRRNEASIAPDGVNNFFLTSYDFWWYDTLDNMMASTYKSAGIAIACASAMIFLTSKSISMMIFSGISITYVVLAATASLVGVGWTLGLFESILFAILIGIGCDFVIHFSHAYTMRRGVICRHERTRFALLHMGPSVLASWATTLITAIIMLFTELTYFRKFSFMLLMTMVHSFIGSFIVLLSFCDCLGPSDPHYFFGSVKSKLIGFCRRQDSG